MKVKAKKKLKARIKWDRKPQTKVKVSGKVYARKKFKINKEQ